MTTDASVPYAVQGASHGAQLFRLAVNSTLPLGVKGLQSARGGICNTTDFAVTAGTGNSVSVAPGQAWVAGTQGADQGLYYCLGTSTVSLAITPNASNPLYALVTASVNDAAYSGNPGVTSNEWDLLVTQGTAASSPLVPTVPDNSLVLATVLVPANASSSASYTIYAGYGTAGAGTNTIGAPSGKIYQANAQNLSSAGFQQLTLGSVAFLRGGMLATSSNSALTLPVAGIYMVQGQIKYNSPSNSEIQTSAVYQNGVEAIEGSLGYATVSVNGTGSVVSGTVSANAGDLLWLVGYTGSSGTTQIESTGSPLYNYLSATLVSF
jgi:hypothetical protein